MPTGGPIPAASTIAERTAIAADTLDVAMAPGGGQAVVLGPWRGNVDKLSIEFAREF